MEIRSDKLLNPLCDINECGIEEYIEEDGSRVVRLYHRPDQYFQHNYLGELGIDMLEASRKGDETYGIDPEDFTLMIPEGSQQLESQLRLIAKDVDRYGQIIFMFFDVLSQYKKGDVMPTSLRHRGILNSFLCSDSSLEYGVSIKPIIPYYLEPYNQVKLVETVREEMIQTGVFSMEQINDLLDVLLEYLGEE